jgi:hypothetical protein
MNAPWEKVAVPSRVVCVPVAFVASSVSLMGLRVVWFSGRESDIGSDAQVDSSSGES